MKSTNIRRIIKEEIAYVKVKHVLTEIYNTESKYDIAYKLHEGILSSILNLFIEPKFRKKAEAIKNSAEYKELEQQIKVSSKALDQLTSQLKKKIAEYEDLINNLQNDGIDVKMGDSMEKIIQKTKQHHKDILKKYKIS